MQKIKIGHLAKFRDRDNFFSAGFIFVSRDFTPYFHFRCVARATFDRNLNHSADACFLVMACVAYSRVKLKTLSSLLKLLNVVNDPYYISLQSCDQLSRVDTRCVGSVILILVTRT